MAAVRNKSVSDSLSIKQMHYTTTEMHTSSTAASFERASARAREFIRRVLQKQFIIWQMLHLAKLCFTFENGPICIESFS